MFKGAGTNSGESGARNLEAESIRSIAENTGGCVKLKTVTEIRAEKIECKTGYAWRTSFLQVLLSSDVG